MAQMPQMLLYFTAPTSAKLQKELKGFSVQGAIGSMTQVQSVKVKVLYLLWPLFTLSCVTSRFVFF